MIAKNRSGRFSAYQDVVMEADPAGALEAMGEAERAAPGPAVANLFNPVPAQRARLLLAQGQVAEAARWTQQRSLAAAEASVADVDDPWNEWLDNEAAHAALAHLPIPQRAALTLRYLDGLPVADVAEHLGRTVHGTETLLARSRTALRCQYEEGHHHAR